MVFRLVLVLFSQLTAAVGYAQIPAQKQGDIWIGKSISHNIGEQEFIWKFSCGGGDCRIGTFLGNYFWIAPKEEGEVVLLESVSPAGEENGVEVNPADAEKQGLLPCHKKSYEPALNVMRKLPLAIQPNSSLVKAIVSEKCQADYSPGCCVSRYDVLTILDAPPQDNGATAFRPGFAGAIKRIFYLEDLDLSTIPSFKPILVAKGQSRLKDIENRWFSPYVDHFMWKFGDAGRAFAPMAALPNYGAEQAAIYLNDLLTIMGPNSAQSKLGAVEALIQRGIDLYTSWTAGIKWPSGAGQQMGRKPPIVFFASVIRDQEIKDRVMRMPGSDTQEGGQIHFKQDTEVEHVPVWGDLGGWCAEDWYWTQLFSSQRYAGASDRPIANGDNVRTCGDPYGWIDGPAGEPGTAYMACCSTGGYIAYSVAQNLMPELCRVSNDWKLNAYVRRILSAGVRTVPDPCAPPDPRESRNCVPYLRNSPECVFYKKTWGPNPQRRGTCIVNGTNGMQQSGRFPAQNGRHLSPIYNEPELSRSLRRLLGDKILSDCN